MSIRYYRELKTGDYLAVDYATADYYRMLGRAGILEARATAITGLASSMSTTSVSRGWLRKECRRVARRNVPKSWLKCINY